MKILQLTVLFILFGPFISNSLVAENITTASGGSIQTDLGYGITINQGSTLKREWITVQDDTIPVEINKTVGVQTVYESEGRYSSSGYKYSAEYSITVKEALTAIEVRFLLFDIWGEHTRNLSATEIIDLAAGTTKTFDGKWNVYSENEVAEFYASIAYIAQVRTADGRVMKTNPGNVLDQAKRFSEKFTESDLEPKPEEK